METNRKNYLWKNISFLRKNKKLSQEKLAYNLNIKKARLGSWEENRAQPNIDKLIHISEYFKIPIDEIITVDLRKKT